MFVASIQLKLSVPQVNSLKEKRMIIKSIIAKCENKFKVSVAEVDTQDLHKIITIGIAYVSSSNTIAQNHIETIIDFILDNYDVVLIETDKNIY